ncbi:hypothetical protein D9M73_165890 [compost metagenome]
MLHGEHGDRDAGGGAFDLQQQPQAWRVRAIKMDADHVCLFPDGQHGVFRQIAVAGTLELRDEFFRGPIMSQIEPQERWPFGQIGRHVSTLEVLVTLFASITNVPSICRLNPDRKDGF